MKSSIIFTFAASLFALLNPLGILPIFVGYTARETRTVQRWLALLLTLTVWGLLVIFLFTGASLLKFFGISLDSFRVAGGILLLLIGLNLVNGTSGKTNQEVVSTDAKSDLQEAESIYRKIVIPLAMPLLVGPGVIANIVLYASAGDKNGGLEYELGLLVAITVVCCLQLAIFLSGRALQKLLGDVGLSIVTRIMGLLIASIGVQFVTTGLSNLIVYDLTPAIEKAITR
jgi:MarC family membrane protein